MATLTIRNNCPYTIWPATLTGGGRPQLGNTGFQLAPQVSSSINVPAPWTGRVWARTGCSTNSGRFVCATADCGSGQVACNGAGGAPPATLAEFTLAPNSRQDFYDISNVDGFNLPLSITPQGGSGPRCTGTSCSANINSVCPSKLAVRGSGGNIIGCKSACVVFGEPQYCCTGEYNSATRCQPTNYSRIFKNQCPQAYSYAYDDQSSTFSCTGGPNYLITFCP
ncbi:Thaumatin [Corchorus capsularis]|uniref:Thaumatin n=1 Tax=Corchorus capsularis TaxID=210143 RepID=A0A1R3IGV3_COCAP|nr:Thaumatin [Corchorus capsularis]